MRNFEVKLGNDTLNLFLSFENISKAETAIGSLMEFASKVGQSKARFVDVVNIYYYLQNGSALSQKQISEKVMEDGLTTHLIQIIKILGEIMAGNKEEPATEKAEKK